MKTTVVLFLSLWWAATAGAQTQEEKLKSFSESVFGKESDTRASWADRFAKGDHAGKGGVGVVRAPIFIALRGPRNEIIRGAGKDWKGAGKTEREVVFVVGNEVFLQGQVPAHFDLTKAILISFEGSIIRYFDFRDFAGGYYKRED